MRVGLTYERKSWFSFGEDDHPDANSELLSEAEECELLEGIGAAGHEVVPIGDGPRFLSRLDHWRSACDIVFNRSVGYRGIERKGIVASLLKAAGIPYVGSTPYVLNLTRHKYHAKLVVADAGAATPVAAVVAADGSGDLGRVRYPALVKPVAESSSIGIRAAAAIVGSPAEAAARARALARAYRQPALVETFVEGIEIEVPILVDPEPRVLALAAVTIDGALPADDHYLASDEVYVDRYDYGAPPRWIDAGRVSAAALLCARALGIRDYGRIDFRVTRDGTPWFIEASTHPHVQRHSGFYYAAAQHGMSYGDMLGEFIRIGARRAGLSAA